ncbi:MAG: hypothetical protein IJR44_02165 [Neisseriaceae bacterium]|nr:hypothetical protein [Neisseriaceae bacterium]
MNTQNIDKCLWHLTAVQSLIDLSLVAIDHPDNLVDRKSLAHCLSLCNLHIEEIRQNLQTHNTITLPTSQSSLITVS